MSGSGISIVYGDITWDLDDCLAKFCQSEFVAAACIAFGIVLVSFLIWMYSRSGSIEPEGKAVVITGCDSGFGFLLAHRLHSYKFQVIPLCLSADSHGFVNLTLLGCDVIKCDVTSDDDVDAMRRQVGVLLEKSGNELWAIVNNAGIADIGFVEWLPLHAYQKVMDVNAFGMIRVLHALVPRVRRSHGRVVNVASLAENLHRDFHPTSSPGRLSVPTFSAYAMSKFAVVALSDSLRMELKQFGVSVSIIQPQLYSTPIADASRAYETALGYWDKLPQHVCRDYGKDYFDTIFKYKIYRSKQELRHNLDEVIDAMVHAVMAKTPKDSYDCHWTAKAVRLLHQTFPSWLTDFFINLLSTTGKAATADIK